MNIKDAIRAKESKKLSTNIPLEDVNRDLILSLFSVSLYGKKAHDEEILEIIINGYKPAVDNVYVDAFNNKKKQYGKDMKMNKKSGYYEYKGSIILEPKK